MPKLKDSDMDNYQRRAVDADNWNVESMIAEEDDPKQRLLLIIMNSIKNALQANTRVAEATASNFAEHLTHYEKRNQDEAALINKGIGAWKIMAWVLGLAQTALIAGVGYVASDLRDIHSDIKTGFVERAKMEIRLTAVETVAKRP